MINSEYETGCRLMETVKYDINYTYCQIINQTCANYIYDIIKSANQYELDYEDKQKMLNLIYNLLGHEIKIDNQNKDKLSIHYFGVISKNDIINEDTIVSLNTFLSRDRHVIQNVNTCHQIVVYAYPQELGRLQSIKDQNNFELFDSFTESKLTIKGIDFFVYSLTDPSTVDNYKIIFN